MTSRPGTGTGIGTKNKAQIYKAVFNEINVEEIIRTGQLQLKNIYSKILNVERFVGG